MNFMRKPKRPTPLALGDLRYDPAASLYSRTENGITYLMPLELSRALKEYYRNYPSQMTGKIDYPTMDQWYRELKNDQKKQVTRNGNLAKETSDFYPDAIYD